MLFVFILKLIAAFTKEFVDLLKEMVMTFNRRKLKYAQNLRARSGF
jgi:hypothetical protein